MKLAIDLVRSQMTQVTALVDESECRSRRKFLLFRGIEETAGENLKEAVSGIVVEKLKLCDFTPDCIQLCFRLGRDATLGGARPILVKFRSLDVRSGIWRSKKNLKGCSVSIAEYLTPFRRSLFNEARKAYGVYKCWSQDGCVYLVTADGKKHRVVSQAQLREIMQKFPPPSKDAPAAAATKPKPAKTATPSPSTSAAPGTSRSTKTGRFVAKPK